MTRRFRKRDFVSLSSLPAKSLGLSGARSEHLGLIRAWSNAAGARLAAKATPVALQRGVLLFRLTVADDAWEATLRGLIPSLAARMARELPDRGIRAVRLTSVHGDPLGEPIPIDDREPAESPARDRRPGDDPASREDSGPLRLEEVMRAYLSRSGSDSSSD